MKNEKQISKETSNKGNEKCFEKIFLVSELREYGVMLDTIKNPIFSSVKRYQLQFGFSQLVKSKYGDGL